MPGSVFHIKYLSRQHLLLLCSWKCFSNGIHSHWLLRGHMTYNNETFSRQNLSADNIAKVYNVRE